MNAVITFSRDFEIINKLLISARHVLKIIICRQCVSIKNMGSIFHFCNFSLSAPISKIL